MDDGAPKLPNDLEQPVVTPPAATPPPVTPPRPIPPPIVPPTITPPPNPPAPPTPPPTDIPEESPEPIKPKSNFKKNLPKIASGLLVMALLIGGIITGRNLIQQQARVEQQAFGPRCQDRDKASCGNGCMDDKTSCRWSTVLEECQKKNDSSCSGPPPPPPPPPGGGENPCSTYGQSNCNTQCSPANYQCVWKNNECKTSESKCSPPPPRSGGNWCNASGCTAPDGKSCVINRYHCNENDKTQCSDEKTGTSTSHLGFIANCGMEQIDIICDNDTANQDFSSQRYTINCVNTPQNHSECQNNACVTVSGAGADECSTDSQCGGGGASPRPSPSASPSPSPSISCVDLTSNKAAPTLGDTVNLTCEGNFSSTTNPYAQFYVTVNNVGMHSSANIPLDASKKASYSFVPDSFGDWKAQCRVCTSTGTCTQWGQAN